MKKFFMSVKNEILKQKRGCIWAIIIGSPLVTGMLDFLNLFIRYDYLVKRYKDIAQSSWEIMLWENHFLWVFLLSLSVVLISSLISYVELSNGGWRYSLTLPVSKKVVYLSKGFTATILCFIMIFLHSMILIIIGKILGFTEPLNYIIFMRYVLYECGAALGMISLQFWLSSKFKNIIIPLAIGFVGICSSYFFAQSKVLSLIFPYSYEIFTLPLMGEEIMDNYVATLGGLIFGGIMFVIGTLEFSKKDIF